MAKGMYIGVSSKARKVKKIYIGVSGKARKVKKVYIGVSGKARLCWSGSTPYNIIAIFNSNTRGNSQATTDSFSDFTEYSNLGAGFYVQRSKMVFFNGKFFACLSPSSNSTYYGIYYRTSISGSWTLAKTLYSGSSRMGVNFYVYNGTLYAISDSTQGFNVANKGYLTSSNGTSWSSSYPTSANTSSYAGNDFRYAIYDGKLYLTSANTIAYTTFASMTGQVGNFTPTTFYSYSTSSAKISNLVIDSSTGIGYFDVAQSSGSSTPYSCYGYLYVINMSNPNVVSYKNYPKNSRTVWNSPIAYGYLFKHNGNLYARTNGSCCHAPLLSSVNDSISWASGYEDAYNDSGPMFLLDDKIITLDSTDSSHAVNVCSRSGDTLTVLATVSGTSAAYKPNAFTMVFRDSHEPYAYD